jgi:aspartate aminotransferase
MMTVNHSPTLTFNKTISDLLKEGREIISLGLGEAEVGTPEHIKQAAWEAMKNGFTKYSESQGLKGLREAIAEKLLRDNRIRTSPENIVVTPGAKNALFLACAAILQPGDEVINISPCYVSNVPILQMAAEHVKIHNVELIKDRESFVLDRERIVSLMNEKTQMIFINYPHNPTGKLISAEEIEFLRQLVARKNIYILSDEVYERLVFGENRHISIGSFDDVADHVITVNGFSKAYFMTGWRIGYVNARTDLAAKINRIHQHLNTNTPAFTQKAALAALTGPQDDLENYLGKLNERRAFYKKMLSQTELMTGTDAEGGFFSFINISRAGMKSDAFATRLLLETGVAVLPGRVFGDSFDDYCRLSFTNHTTLFREGLERIAMTVERHAKR